MNGQVSDVEDRLREAYRAAAETIKPDGIPPLHEPMTVIARGRRRRLGGRVLVPLAAAAAIVAIVAGVPALRSGLVPGSARSGNSATGPGATAPPSALAIPQGAPPYFVAIANGAVNVYSTATAQVVSTITAPGDGAGFEGIAAVYMPGVYVVAAGRARTCGTRLYTLQVNSGVKSPELTPLSVATLPEDVFSIAMTGDGLHLAWAGEYCAGPHAGTGDIGVADLGTGAIKRWTAPGNEDIGSVSLSANGSQIGFVVQQTQLYQPLAGILPADAPAGTVAQRAHVVVQQNLVVAGDQLSSTGVVTGAAALSPDGRRLYVCGVSESATDMLLTVSGGRATRQTYLKGSGPCALSLDPSGQFLLAQTSSSAGRDWPVLELIDLATGSMTILPAQGIGAQIGVWATW